MSLVNDIEIFSSLTILELYNAYLVKESRLTIITKHTCWILLYFIYLKWATEQLFLILEVLFHFKKIFPSHISTLCHKSLGFSVKSSLLEISL